MKPLRIYKVFTHSPRDLCFVLCSLDLDVLRAQRITGFFYLNYPEINEVGKSDPMECIAMEFRFTDTYLCFDSNHSQSMETSRFMLGLLDFW